MVQAPAPARLIEGGLLTDATIAHVVVAKYADHCPLYPAGPGLPPTGPRARPLDPGALDRERRRAAEAAARTAAAEAEASGKLFADETRAPVLDAGRRRTKLGQLWAYARDDRPWGGTEPPGVAFVYAGDRATSSPAQHLAGFRGILQTDGYGAYKALAKAGAVELAFCWTHTRRYFHKLLDEKDPANADRCGGDRPHRAALRDRGRDSGAIARRASNGATGQKRRRPRGAEALAE